VNESVLSGTFVNTPPQIEALGTLIRESEYASPTQSRQWLNAGGNYSDSTGKLRVLSLTGEPVKPGGVSG
jgi:hypothetical protein